MSRKILLLVSVLMFASFLLAQNQPAPAPPPAGPPQHPMHHQMAEMHKQHMEAMKADLDKMKASLDQMKANVANISDANEKARWQSAQNPEPRMPRATGASGRSRQIPAKPAAIALPTACSTRSR